MLRKPQGMEGLIKQAFSHVDVIGHHVMEGHYDLTGPDGEIILPQVWDTMIKPDWEVSMHMWPMPEPPKPKTKEPVFFDGGLPPGFDLAGFGIGPGPGPAGVERKKSKKIDTKKKRASTIGAAHVVDVGPMAPPPPPPPPGGPPMFPPVPPGHGVMLSDPLGMAGFPPGVMPVFPEDPRPKANSKAKASTKKSLPPLAAWMAGRKGR